MWLGAPVGQRVVKDFEWRHALQLSLASAYFD